MLKQITILLVCFALTLCLSCSYTLYQGSDRLLRHDPPKERVVVNSVYDVELNDVSVSLGMVLIKFYVHEKRTEEHGEELYDRLDQKSTWLLKDLTIAYDGPAVEHEIDCNSLKDLMQIDEHTAVTNEMGVAIIRGRLKEGLLLAGDPKEMEASGLSKYLKNAEPDFEKLKIVYNANEGFAIDGEKLTYSDSTYVEIDLINAVEGLGSFIRQRLLKPFKITVFDTETDESIDEAEVTIELLSSADRLLSRQFGDAGARIAQQAFPYVQNSRTDGEGTTEFKILKNAKYKVIITVDKYSRFEGEIKKFSGDKKLFVTKLDK